MITFRVKLALVEQNGLVNCRHVRRAIRLGEDKGKDHCDKGQHAEDCHGEPLAALGEIVFQVKHEREKNAANTSRD